MNRARKWSKPEAQEELAYIQDVLTGKISLSSFNDDWATFSRYAEMQANQAAHSGFVDIADVMQASANRARRKVTKNPKRGPIGTVDQHGARDLYWSIESYRESYPQKMSIIKNLLLKKKKGVYNIALATKLWRYWIDNGAKQYARENGVSFNVPTRDFAARLVAETEDAKMNGGEYSHISLKRGVQPNPGYTIDELRQLRNFQMRRAKTEKARGYRYVGYIPHARNLNRDIVAAKKRAKKKNPLSINEGYVVKARRGATGTVLTYDGAKFTNKGKPKLFATLQLAVRAGTALYEAHPALLKHYRLWAAELGSTARP